MKNVFYFSDYIKPFLKRIKFLFIIAARFITILFRKEKSIKPLQFSYARERHFDNIYLIIRYKFENAIWYNFKNIKQTTEKGIIVLNLKNILETPIELIVYGFFRKEIIPIKIDVKNILESKLFQAELKNIDIVEVRTKPFLLKRTLKLNNPNCALTLPTVSLRCSNVEIKNPSFSQTEFL
ncbi:hypothetical protein QEG73_14920 [Chitinophagaceae bacterium 26-R-25]|nr:hypothetical protein [Chitinophagaceae bacterium 26-R-25]